MLESQKRRLGILIKALNRKLQGDENYGDQLKELLEVGPFEEQITVTVHVRGSKGADSIGHRFFGVSINDMLDLAIGMFGCTEDHYRRLTAACIERKRAALEDRQIQDVEWIGEDGTPHVLTADDIHQAVQTAENRKARMQKDTEKPAFSQLVKQQVKVSGRFEVAYVGAKARRAKPDELRGLEHLKQTKADAEKHGQLCDAYK